MRSFLTIFALLVWLLPALSSASSLKGVRGRKSSLQSRHLKDEDKEMEKKCKKYAEPKAVSEATELKATKADKKDKADPKDAAEKAADGKAADDKMKGDGARYRHRRHLQDEDSSSSGAPKEDKASKEAAKEAECLEWFEATDREDGGSDVVLDPAMGSTGGTISNTDFDSINVDCDAIANDQGPKDTHSVSFNVNIDVLKDSDATLNDIYDAMENELQTKVAPRIAGCSSGRFLAEESSSTKIVHVDFGELEFDHRGCDSSLAKEASEMDGVCMASDVPVDVYFVGDFPKNAIAKVEVAIEEHEWDIDGLLKTSEVAILQTGSTMPQDEGANAGMIGGIVAAVVVCLCGVCGYCYYKRGQDDEVVAKAELETDEESDDDDKKKIAVPEVQARRVG